MEFQGVIKGTPMESTEKMGLKYLETTQFTLTLKMIESFDIDATLKVIPLAKTLQCAI